MRDSVRERIGARVGDHLGLAYTTLAPVEAAGKVPDGIRVEWLRHLAGTQVAADYQHHLEAWIAAFPDHSTRLFILTFETRLLVGHGNRSGADVGLTVHHTWGTPVVPGSALKGIVAHHVAATRGTDPDATEPDPARDPWRGVRWNGKTIAHGPGSLYRTLFGAPDAEDDQANGAPGAARGHVVFHDALYFGVARNSDDRVIPGPLRPSPGASRPFAADTLTVHQKPYYDARGRVAPTDHADPVPVGFLTVRPMARFLVALEGPSDWTALAGELLREALVERGVGGKTSSGYGHGDLVEVWPPPPPLDPTLVELQAWLDQERAAGTPQRQIAEQLTTSWISRVQALTAADRRLAVRAVRKAIRSRRVDIESLCADLLDGGG